MNKFMLSAAAVIVLSSLSMSVSAGERSHGPRDGRSCNGDVCDLKIIAEVEEKCYCSFEGRDYVNLGKLNAWRPTTSQPKKLRIYCNTRKADVQVRTKNDGLKGLHDHYGDEDVDYIIKAGGYQFDTNADGHKGYQMFANNFMGDYLNIMIQSKPYNFKKVKPGHKFDIAYFKVTPVKYY
ncbi:hypothetical protein [Photobacterium galatheae]|uniref:Spore coat protein U domain-containing protein n=1 Tax=Photobacterium galatheae TaxID=1654360 RepID=A0A066RUK4_9GAMM|nr:hypothetical protein [Photobacterium galatheae]KDM91063.1 hypothetical protein EA58_12970 [Photobacterium galatheae]MCM0150217.1 hypothetical protein [Photobacterium galatheae]